MQVHISQLSHTYAQQQAAELPALRSINLSIASGDFVAVIGPSGCGKSTLLRLIAGLLAPQSGSLQLDRLTPEQALAAKKIGWLAQNPALLPWRTALDNITLAQQINPRPERGVLSPEELLELVGLEGFGQAYPHTLSGGMQHRVALARTLAIGAPLWLMDEPFSSLDELTRDVLADDVLSLWERFTPTVLWVTHSIYEAVRLAVRVLIFTPRPGRIAADIDIPLPRPRQETSPAVLALTIHVKQQLQAGTSFVELTSQEVRA
jgi:NitT/TauT family transport system ATP-binding protein